MISISSPGLSLRRYSAQSSIHALPPIPATPSTKLWLPWWLLIQFLCIVWKLSLKDKQDELSGSFPFSILAPPSLQEKCEANEIKIKVFDTLFLDWFHVNFHFHFTFFVSREVLRWRLTWRKCASFLELKFV